jgi:FG-GAP-like repeat
MRSPRAPRSAHAGAWAALLLGLAAVLPLAASASSAAGSAPSFAAARTATLGKGAGDLTLADLNGDGKVDLATPHLSSNTVTVLLNRGDGRFGARSTYRTAGGLQLLEEADLNGDGKADLVTANGASVSVLLNRGDGTFQAARDYATPKIPEFTVQDLNGTARPTW